MRTLNLGSALTLSLPQIRLQLTAAKAELTAVRHQAGNLRHQHLLNLDRARASDQETTVEQESSIRIRIESQHAQGRRLRQLKNTARTLVDIVTITVDGITTTCTSQTAMQEALFAEGHRRFSQTNLEPPMQPDITTSMGFYAETEQALSLIHI